MSNQLGFSFGFHGDDLDPDEITALLGIEPSNAHKKGSRGRLPLTSCWYLSTERFVGEAALDGYAILDRFMARLYPLEERIQMISGRSGITAELSVVYYMTVNDEESTPALGMSSRVVEFLGAVKASIDIDSYRAY